MSLLSKLWIAFALGAPALLITGAFLLNPLGIQDAAERRYQANINAVLSPFYPNKQDKVTVVLLDQTFVSQRGGYPLSFTRLRDLQKTLSSYQPQAVFLDFLMHDEHSKNYDRWLSTLKKLPYPLIVASNPDYDTIMLTSESAPQDKSLFRQQLYNTLHKSSSFPPFASVKWSGYGDYYPLVMPEYQGEDELKKNLNLTQSPAWTLFQIYCQDESRTQLNSLCNTVHSRVETNANQPVPDPLLIRWNYTHKGFSTDAERYQTSFNIARMLLMQGLYEEPVFDQMFRVTTPPIDYIKASDLFGQQARTEATKALIENRLILVGYHLGHGIDKVVSPVHGSIAGVFRHAMALDNLIQLDNGYWHMPAEDVIGGLDANDLIEMMVNLLSIVIVLYVGRRQLSFDQVQNTIEGLNRMGSTVKKSTPETESTFTLYLSNKTCSINKMRAANKRLLPWFIAPLVLITLSIYISESVYALGIANWYTLPLIFLFSMHTFGTAAINYLRLTIVKNQIAKKRKVFGVMATIEYWLAPTKKEIDSDNQKQNQEKSDLECNETK